MFNNDIAILPAVTVCITTIGLYRFITWMMPKSELFEKMLEGQPVYIVENGIMVFKDDAKDTLSKDEFFAELRGKGIEHLGQVKTAILETNGNMSVLFYPDNEIQPGLPIFPHAYNQHTTHITHNGLYACSYCGKVVCLPQGKHRCPRCQHQEWVEACQATRNR